MLHSKQMPALIGVIKDLLRFKNSFISGSKAAEKKYGIKNLNKYANSSADKALAAEDKYHTSRESSNTRDYGNRRDYSSNTRDYVNTHDYSRNTNSSGHKTRLKTSLSGVSSLGMFFVYLLFYQKPKSLVVWAGET